MAKYIMTNRHTNIIQLCYKESPDNRLKLSCVATQKKNLKFCTYQIKVPIVLPIVPIVLQVFTIVT